jgi:hypothetical protein
MAQPYCLVLHLSPSWCASQNLLSRAEAIAICASADFVGTPLPAEWASTPEGVEQYKGKLYAAEPQVGAGQCCGWT